MKLSTGVTRMAVISTNRIAGLALVLGGSYMAIWGAAHIAPTLLIGLGILGLHARQARPAGLLGYISLALVVIALLAGGVVESWSTFSSRAASPELYLIVGLLLIVGMVLYGIATLQAKVFPVLGSRFLIGGPLLMILVGVWGAKLGALGFVTLGYCLFANKFQKQADREFSGHP